MMSRFSVVGVAVSVILICAVLPGCGNKSRAAADSGPETDLEVQDVPAVVDLTRSADSGDVSQDNGVTDIVVTEVEDLDDLKSQDSVEVKDANTDDLTGLNPCENGLVPVNAEPEADGRGFRIACSGVAVRIRNWSPGVLRLTYEGSPPHHGLPYALVDLPQGSEEWLTGLTGSSFTMCNDGFTVHLETETCRVTVFDADGTAILEDSIEGGYSEVETEWLGTPYKARRVERITPPDELFYGFGEKTGPLDKRGRKMVFWSSDTPGYPVDMDPLYQSIPFFIGMRQSRAYGIFVNNVYPAEFDMAAAKPERYSLQVMQGDLDQFVIAGPAIKDVLQRYAGVTGSMPLPPRWSLGYHQARWSYYPDTQVLDIAQGFRSRDIPADVIWLDIDYMDGFRSFTFDPIGFSDPAGLTAQLKQMGFKTVVIIDPGLKSDPGWDIYDEGLADGHFLLGADGQPFVGEVWPGPSVFPDFTRPETRNWWAGLVPRITNFGVHGIWLDMNEPANFLAQHNHTVPGDVIAAGETEPITMDGVHNAYALAEAKATYEGLLEAVPGIRPFLLTRAGFAGIQRYSAVWTGDAASTMESLKMSFTMLLGLGLSGVPFVGSDVGGWTGDPGPELFARWIQVGSMSPFFRTHVATDTPDQEPWSYDLEVEDISRLTIGARYELVPYLYSLFHETSVTGIPVLRAMPVEFQDDPTTFTLSTQGMLGPWLLTAPVLAENAQERVVYLPPGRWLEWTSGALYEGPSYITVDVTLQALPLFLREGSIVPRGPLYMHTDAGPLAPLRLDLFPGPSKTSFTLYEDDGVSLDYQAGMSARTPYTLQATSTGATLVIESREGSYEPPARAVLVRVRPVDGEVAGVTLNDIAVPQLGSLNILSDSAPGYFHDSNDRSLWVAIEDQDNAVLKMIYEPQTQPAQMVNVPILVHLPSGTPQDTPIHVATSASNWEHQPLEWGDEPGTAKGWVPVPRGHWFEYKYTRGDWTTVEKWAGCTEADNRYHFGKATPVKEDTVVIWADDPGC